ncbi:hypothetical protein MPL3356_60541 [Mesorhizobium plurifarium]|uniref:HNH nuclease domain-containing protein n=1 Tax=Mesorhizobium plurifarium TaxID=69974 RepID=A0A090G6Z7_MESPL|nr:hypothetical protein MPL3356_60541 [Mesorhizobium plurifarium]
MAGGGLMVKSTLPPRFKFSSAPRFKAIEVKTNTGRHRISPRKRGYDARWDRLAMAFRRANPYCRFCEQEGRDGLADVTDHILPAHEYPDLRYVWSNFQSLCSFHHDNLKQKLEHYARKNGLLDKLAEWSADPDSRPVHLRPIPK